MTSATDTYVLAHTVQCKLKIAANRPDRNLRFILGHALTLDNLLLRVVEIDEQADKMVQEARENQTQPQNRQGDAAAVATTAATPPPPPDSGAETGSRGRRISFTDRLPSPKDGQESQMPGATTPRKRSPPPPAPASAMGLDSDSSEEDYADLADEIDDDPGLGLVRFGSGSAQPPGRGQGGAEAEDLSSDDEEDEPEPEPKTPPSISFSEPTLRELTGEEGDEDLAELYEKVRGCCCHGHGDVEKGGDGTMPVVERAWEVPREKWGNQEEAKERPASGRVGVIQVRA